jgi:RHS repeat-associated protein
MPQVSALPVGLADGATLVLLAQTGKTQKFAIQNTGPLSTQFNYYAGCSGAASCAVTSVSKTTSTLAASGRDTVTVTYDVSGSQAVNGVVKLFAKYTADTSFVKDSGWVNVVTPSPTLVTPDAGTASPAAGLGSSQTFLVKNTGPLPMSLRLAPVCTGVGLVTGRCASSVDGLFLNGGDSTLVTVAYQPVTGGGAGRIVLRATEVITSTLLDSGYVNVNAPVPPLAIVEVPEARAGATIEKDNCLVFALRVEVAAECGVLRVTHSLPAVRTMNKARVPTLIYYYDQAILINVFGVNVTLPASTPTPDSISVVYFERQPDGSYVEQMRKTHRGSYWGTGSRARRVGIQRYLDQTSPSHILQYRIVTQLFTGGSMQEMPAIDGEFSIIQRRVTSFGEGWWLAGLEQLRFGQPAGTTSILWIGGDGSARKYVRSAGNANIYAAQSVDRPDSLVYSGTDGTYTRYAGHGLTTVFDAFGRHIRTVNRLGHVTTFAYEDTTGRLSTITVPPAGAGLVYQFHYTAGFLDVITAPEPQPGTTRTVTITRTLTNGVAAVSRITDPDGTHVDFIPPSWRSWDGLIEGVINRRGDTTSFIAEGYAQTVGIVRTNRAGGGVDSLRLRMERAFGSPPVSVQPEPPSLDTVSTYTRDGRGNVTRFWTDAFGSVSKIQNALLDSALISRGDLRFPGLVTKLVQVNGHTVNASYDDHGNVTASYDVNPLGDMRDAVTRFHWDRAWDFADSVITPTGLVTRRKYDAATGNRLWEQPAGDSTRRVLYAYWSNGLLRSTTMPGTPGDAVLYDALGNVAETHSPLNYGTIFTRDLIGRDTLVKSQIDPAGVYSQLGRTKYDLMDRDTLTQSYGPAMYANAGDTLSVYVRTYYNPEGQADSVKRWSAPDVAGVGILKTSLAYDRLGRVVAEVAVDGAIDSTYYDAAGNAVISKPRNAASFVLTPYVTMEYDALNRLTIRRTPAVRYAKRIEGLPKYFGPIGAPEQNVPYPTFPNDGFGGITTPADAAMLDYDKLGMLKQAVNRDARVWRTYYPNGLLKTETDSIRTVKELSNNGNFIQHAYTLQYSYDLDGRLSQLKHPAQLVQGATLDHSSYGYDALTGALDTVTDVMNQQFRYHYTLRGDLDSLYIPNGISEGYGYDADGNRTRHVVRDPNGFGFMRDANGDAKNETLTYDARGKKTWTGNSSINLDTLTVTYNGLGHTRTSALSVRGANWSGNDFKYTTSEHFTNDGLANLAYKSSDLANTVYTSRGGAKFIPFFATTEGNWSSLSDFYQGYTPGTGRYAWRQDNYQMDTAKYDAAGNTLFTYQKQHTARASLADRASYYSADGTLYAAEYRAVPDDGSFRFTRVFEEYRYDALGRRVFVRSRRWCQNFGIWYLGECNESWVRRTVWDGSAELYEIQMPDDSVGTTTTGVVLRENDTESVTRSRTSDGWDVNPFYGRVAYVYGHGVDQPLSITRFRYSDWPANDNYWDEYPTFTIVPYWNTRGEVYDVTFVPGKALQCLKVNRCAKFNFPLIWQAYGEASKIPLYFHGTLATDKLDKTGTFYRRNRTYDPVTGLFTQEDPIGLAGGLNTYGFANGDPINYSDPFGLDPEEWGKRLDAVRKGIQTLTLLWAILKTSVSMPMIPPGSLSPPTLPTPSVPVPGPPTGTGAPFKTGPDLLREALKGQSGRATSAGGRGGAGGVGPEGLPPIAEGAAASAGGVSIGTVLLAAALVALTPSTANSVCGSVPNCGKPAAATPKP